VRDPQADQQRWKRLAGGAIILVLALSPIAQASKFHGIETNVRAFASDGTRYVAWEAMPGQPIAVIVTPTGHVTAFDTLTGHRRTTARPPGCELVGHRSFEPLTTAAAGRFLLACGTYQQRLLNAATGQITPLPVLGGTWEKVGALYVDGDVDARLCPRSRTGAEQVCRALYDIATGAISYRPLSQQPDLDRPNAAPICARLGRKLNFAEERSTQFGYWDGILVEVAQRRGDVIIERCNGRPVTLGGSGEPEYLDARGGLLTWDTGHPADSLQAEETGELKNGELRRGTLFSDVLATHKRRSWRLPQRSLEGEVLVAPTNGVFGYSTHTRNMVFWIATRYCYEGPGPGGGSCGGGETFSVYGGRL
jgi:hypothetical protein